uniref:Ig-like domain-containing protein n=1 Tax=Branchiostoma floridae TaxID=7739 RepID=C3ZKG6_BRAFL|eukprot:XP_002591054.1 hypothetical protein BRAFLDRAFT_69392 [Branchiostoma floridae]
MPRLAVLVVLMVRFVACFSCINFECCDVSGENPPTVINCTKKGNIQGISTLLPVTLQVLVIKSQMIDYKVITRDHLPYLPNLHFLAIINSRVATVHLGSFEALPNLTTLDLSGNKIRKLQAGTFRGLQQLRTLDLQRNHIRSVDNGTFVELHKLEKLDLSGNCLPRIPEDIWILKSVIEVNLSLNKILQSPLEDLQRFERTESLTLNGAGVLEKFDCTALGIRDFIFRHRHLRWDVYCTPENGGLTFLNERALDSLTCEAPKISIVPTTQAVNIQETVSFTCRADCKERLHFSWLLPNGEELPSTSEYTEQYTKAIMRQCKFTNVRTYEKRTVCYSVLNITTTSGANDTAGTYTCRVTGNHTLSASASSNLTMNNVQVSDTLEGKVTHQQHAGTTPHSAVEGLDTDDVTRENKNIIILLSGKAHGEPDSRGNISVYVVLSCSFVVYVILVVALTVREVRTRTKERNRHVRSRDEFNRMSNAEEDNKTYENDDQFLHEEDSGNRGIYENDDQFSDRDFGDKTYENDDQLPAEDAEDQLYENNDQFSDGEAEHVYDNDDELSPKYHQRKMPHRAPAHPLPDNAVEATPSHRPRRINRKILKPSMCKAKVTVVEEGIEEGHYDNDSRRCGQAGTKSAGNHMGTKVSRHATSEAQRKRVYDNERQLRESLSRKLTKGITTGSNVFATKTSEFGFGNYDNEIQKRASRFTRPRNPDMSRDSLYVSRSSIIAAKRRTRQPAGARPWDNVVFRAPDQVGHYNNEGRFIAFAESTKRSADKRPPNLRSRGHMRQGKADNSAQEDGASGFDMNNQGINDYITEKRAGPSEPDYLDIQKADSNIQTSDEMSDDNSSDHEYFAFPGSSGETNEQHSTTGYP